MIFLNCKTCVLGGNCDYCARKPPKKPSYVIRYTLMSPVEFELTIRLEIRW